MAELSATRKPPHSKIMADQQHKAPERIAIIGGGIAGIACLWGLRNLASGVHLYEANAHVGGHSHSFTLENNNNATTVDTGFIVAQEDMYPTDMSFSVSEGNGSMVWSGVSVGSFIGDWSRLCTPWFWRLVFDIVRFNIFATDIFGEKAKSHRTRRDNTETSDRKHHRLESVGEYLDRNRYSKQFKRYYLVPITASPWYEKENIVRY
ncbi:hypothetical protein UA08_00939 [Talaromyces atroroseus]|uniref:Amine oxidase domain-containing protein n=1 Tax=Talaromyces atroroseus TaxID=1441469 RepID=A0A225AXC4_TALAT|nr:hypothetical protein UA08_00939 [Talaromyces atroroseus]OKL64263.1 hypothetical protein UA08_00939 [Talaromyces atroroseus]